MYNEMPSVESLFDLHHTSLDEQLIKCRKDLERMVRENHMDDVAYNKIADDIQKLYAEAVTIVME